MVAGRRSESNPSCRADAGRGEWWANMGWKLGRAEGVMRSYGGDFKLAVAECFMGGFFVNPETCSD